MLYDRVSPILDLEASWSGAKLKVLLETKEGGSLPGASLDEGGGVFIKAGEWEAALV